MNAEQSNRNSKKILSNKSLLFFMLAIFLFASTLRTPITALDPLFHLFAMDLAFQTV